MSIEPLKLVPATRAHLLVIMGWFPSSDSCRIWGGPEFRFPFTAESFYADCHVTELPSFVLLNAGGSECGFGQYYLCAARCHLARLAVAPTRRGQGFGTRLIELLAATGKAALGVEQCSLFVSIANTEAMALYRRLGFALTDHAGDTSLPGAYYMIR